MSDFDPYLKWLGIREKARPLNHYRLLGLELFESDKDVISMAADRHMTHIRTFQNGPNGQLSQQILNELARARRCLLSPDKKSEYDALLRRSVSAVPEIIDAQTVQPVLAVPPLRKADVPSVAPNLKGVGSADSPTGGMEVNVAVQADQNARAKIKKRERKQMIWGLFGWISGGVAAVGVAAALIGSGWIGNFRGGDDPDGDEFADVDLNVDPDPTPEAVPRGDPKPKPDSDSNKNLIATNNVKPGNGTNSPSDPNKPAAPARQVYEPDPELTRYNVNNLDTYPRANPADFAIFGEVRKGLGDKKKRLIRLEPSTVLSGTQFGLRSNSNGMLIGAVVKTDKANCAAWIKPIFFDGFTASLSSQKAGEAVDKEVGQESFLSIAKPGYAVGEIEVSAVNPVYCVRLKFMKIAGSKLDPNDAYAGRWMGSEIGPRRTIQNPNGFPIVGFYGTPGGAGSGRLESLSLFALANPGFKSQQVASFKLPGAQPSKTPNEIPGDDGIDPFANPNVAKPDPAAMPKPEIAKIDEPSSREQTAAKKRFSDSVKLTLEDAKAEDTPRGIISRAERLLELADDEDDTDVMYAILEEAERLGIAAGDAQTAVAAVRSIDEVFEIDFWTRVRKTIEKAASNSSSSTASNFKETIDDLIMFAKRNAFYSEANKLVLVATKFAKRAKDLELVDEYASLGKEIRYLDDLYEENTKALNGLRTDPANTKLNLTRAEFMFIANKDLKGAIQFWEKSGNNALVEIAGLESDFGALSLADRKKLADAWFKLSKSQRTPFEDHGLDRAHDIYRSIVGSLRGSEKEEVDNRIGDVIKLLRD